MYERPLVCKICTECGNKYIGHPQSKYCDDCRPIVLNRQRHESQKRRLALEKMMQSQALTDHTTSKKKPAFSIAEVAKAAKEAGMSYGEFVNRYKI